MSAGAAAGVGGAWRRPRWRLRSALQLLAFFLAIGTLQGLAVMATWRAEGPGAPWLPPLGRQLTGAIAAWMALPIVQLAALNAPGPRVGWGRLVGVHAAGFVLFSAVKTAIMLSARVPLDRLIPGIASRQPLSSQLFWETQLDVVLYGCLAAFWSLLYAWDDRRAALLHAARLDSQLASARLSELSAQVNPHFLFNALNTVSALMYEDLPRTERLLSSLGQILRATLAPGGVTWSLAEERGHGERYVDLLLARFGDQLAVSWQLPAALDAAQVPRFCVVTLVENAIKHNRDRAAPLRVTISGAREGGLLRLVVEDDGRGFAAGAADASGGGLARLRETLRLLHGERARLEVADPPGARVELRFPAGGSG